MTNAWSYLCVVATARAFATGERGGEPDLLSRTGRHHSPETLSIAAAGAGAGGAVVKVAFVSYSVWGVSKRETTGLTIFHGRYFGNDDVVDRCMYIQRKRSAGHVLAKTVFTLAVLGAAVEIHYKQGVERGMNEHARLSSSLANRMDTFFPFGPPCLVCIRHGTYFCCYEGLAVVYDFIFEPSSDRGCAACREVRTHTPPPMPCADTQARSKGQKKLTTTSALCCVVVAGQT